MHCQGKVRKRIIYSLFLKGIKLTYDRSLHQCSQEQTLHASALSSHWTHNQDSSTLDPPTQYTPLCAKFTFGLKIAMISKRQKQETPNLGSFSDLIHHSVFLSALSLRFMSSGSPLGHVSLYRCNNQHNGFIPAVIARQAFKMQFQDKAIKR